MKSDKIKINQINPKYSLNKIRSKYILQIIIDNLKLNKTLEIIKYNEKTKKRIGININNYKEYREKYSSIEIEIKPANNKYGKFINYIKDNEKYHHLYFNNSEEEIKRNYINKDEEIQMIKIIIDYQINSFDHLFSDCDCIESIYFKKNFIEIILIQWAICSPDVYL